MKTKLVGAGPLTGMIAGLLLTASLSVAADFETTYQQGRTAYYQGNTALAQKLLTQALAMSPNHVPIKAMLADIAVNSQKAAPSLKTQYASVIIPRFELNEATLGESLQALTMMAKDRSGGKVTPNFIVKSPDLNKVNLTLSLTNAPMDEVIRYLGDLAKAKVTWDKHAVVFSGISD